MNRLLRIFFILLLLLFTFGISLLVIQPRIPLHGLISSASPLLSNLTGKSITVGGTYSITPGIWTILEIDDGEITLQDEAAAYSVQIATAATTVHLFSLFRKELVLNGLSLHGLVSDIYLKAGEQDDEAAEFSRNLSTAFSFEITGAIDISGLKMTITDGEFDTPQHLKIDRARGFISDAYQGQLDLLGSVAGEPITIRLKSDAKQRATEAEPVTVFEVDLEYKSMAGIIRGELDRHSNLPFLACDAGFSGKHIKDALSLLGIKSNNNNPFSIGTEIWLTEQNSKFLLTELRPGTTDMIASLTVNNYQQEKPQYHLSVQAEKVDLDLLESWFDPAETIDTEAERDDPGGKDSILDAIPDNFTFSMNLAKLKFNDQTASDIEVKAVADNAGITQSPFTARLENTDFRGYLSIDRRAAVPSISVKLQSQRWDIGNSLSSQQLAEGLGFIVNEITIDAASQGHSVTELGSNLSYEITADNGLFSAMHPGTDSELRVVLDKTTISGGAGKKLQYEIEGTINEFPISVAATIEAERDASHSAVSAARVNQFVTVGATRWELEGSIPLPFSLDNFSLTSNLEGPSLSELNGLLNFELPHTAPYSGSATITAVPDGYQLTDLHITAGESLIAGAVSFNGSTEPPQLSATLFSEKIQLDDFIAVSPVQAKTANNAGDNISEKKGLKRFQDQDIVETYNAEITLEVKELLSGDDRLGGGLLTYTQRDGKLYLAPLRINLPEGSIEITFIRKPVSGGYNYLLNTRVDELDYGIMARHLNPDSDSSGKISVRSSIYSDSSDFVNLMANATGYIDFSVEPKKLRAGVIDLWAVNLLSYLTPLLVPKNESTINCVAGQFDIVHGNLTERDFLIDTSKIQVSGTVSVDFEKGWIDAYLKPRPKRPQFYSLATPIRIKGKLADLKAGVYPGGVIGTTIRLATSYVAVPFQWLTRQRVPADNRQQCQQIIRERGNLVEEWPGDAD